MFAFIFKITYKPECAILYMQVKKKRSKLYPRIIIGKLKRYGEKKEDNKETQIMSTCQTYLSKGLGGKWKKNFFLNIKRGKQGVFA